MNTTDIYRHAIERTFADLYGVPPDTVEVTWPTEGRTITVRCAGEAFIHLVFSDPDDGAPEFLSPNEDSVDVTLTEDERNQLQCAILKNEC
jgi:hypothetical protein